MFKKLKIGVKLITGFLTVAIIAGLIGIIGIINLKNMAAQDRELYEKVTQPLQYAAIIIERFHRLRVNLYILIQSKTEQEIGRSEKQIFAHLTIFNENMEKVKKTLLTDKGKEIFQGMVNEKEKYLNHLKQVISMVKLKKAADAAEYTKAYVVNQAALLQKNIDALMKLKVDTGHEISDENIRAANTSTVILIAISIVGFITAFILGIFLARSISRPLASGVIFAKRISEKDLTARLNQKLINRGDEIGDLSRALDEMQNNLVTIITELTDVSSNLAASAEEIASSSQNLADGAQTQSASVEETSASIEELSSAVIQVADNAVEVNAKSDELLRTAEDSAVLVENAVTGMEKINESSVQISEILGVINDIADQTNLLALNAAIEAARAGEHGRGFAVVADEISKLAEKSTENAKQIEKLIKQSIKDVSSGSDIVKKAGEAFSAIILGVNKNSKLIEQITGAVEQQKTGAQQVQKAIENINDITQSTSASAEEMAASTEELQSQAEKIAIMIEEFKLMETTNNEKGVTVNQ